MDLADRKARLRVEMAGRRRAVTRETAKAAAALVAARVASLPAFVAARRVALYAALPDELPTRPLFDAILGAGKAAYLPRMVGRGMEFAPVRSWEELRLGRYGVLVPPPDAPAVEALDLALIPGVAFDRRGHRLGRGGGYYDRAFAGEDPSRPVLVGVAYDFQVVAEVPVASWDRNVDAIVSELAIYPAVGPA